MMEKVMAKAKVKIWDGINKKFRPTRFKVEEISTNSVKISGIYYSRKGKGKKLIGRVIVNISSDKHRFGMSFPIYA